MLKIFLIFLNSVGVYSFVSIHLNVGIGGMWYSDIIRKKSQSEIYWSLLSSVARIKPSGLLSGIDDIDNSIFFTDNLSLDEAYQLIQNSGTLYKRFVEKDGGVEFEEMFKNAEKFIYSNELWDRIELNETLREVTSTAQGGKFGCLLGGKSSGKSLILKILDESKVFVINLRKNDKMLTGIINTLKARNAMSQTKIIEAVTQQSLNFLTDKMGNKFDFEKFYNTISGKSDTPKTFESVILELIDTLGPITLVFDEANLALDITDSSSESDINDVKSALALFTLLTKEEKKLNVLLVSSEHSFPFKLSNPKLKFNVMDFTDYIFAGEVPPKDMYQLLTNKWKMDSDFAKILIDVYGGHIWDVYQALRRLKRQKTDFTFISYSLTVCIQKCMDWKLDSLIDNNNMKETLKQLAKTGFVPLQKIDDPLAKAISEFGVGGVALLEAEVIGLNKNIRRKYPKCKYGIIPSKQSMRLAIAEYFEDISNSNTATTIP